MIVNTGHGKYTPWALYLEPENKEEEAMLEYLANNLWGVEFSSANNLAEGKMPVDSDD